MPPEDVERPVEQIDTLVKFLETEFTRADAIVKPDPGRVTARRLNRAEYTNTIRDLLAVDFRADQNFPDRRLGRGLRQHRRRADGLAGADGQVPVRGRPDCRARDRRDPAAQADRSRVQPRASRTCAASIPSNVEATHRIDFDADYELRIGLPGERPKDAQPVTLGLWVDGKLTQTHHGRDQALRARLLQSVLGGADARCPCRKAITRSGSASSTTSSSRPCPKESLYKDKENKWIGSVTVRRAVRRRRQRSPAARRS